VLKEFPAQSQIGTAEKVFFMALIGCMHAYYEYYNHSMPITGTYV
jgi:hypothetical protein